MIILKQIKKDYVLGSTIVQALRGIDLVINKQEFISICGPSGSGKSTLLNLLGCIDLPTSGKIHLFGQDVTSLSDKVLSSLRNQNIGFIFQSFNLIPVLNVFENVEYPLLMQNIGTKERKDRILPLLEEVGLTQFIKHKPDELSGGQRQRVAIARALVTHPKLVLADEPTANLDSVTGTEILNLMKRMNAEHHTTFVFSTHDPNVMQYANKIYHIKDGVIEL